MDRGGRPEHQGPRGWVWWLGVALVQAAGLSIAAFAFFLAALFLPSTGLFSDPNSAGDRAVGVVAAAVACVAVVSGPLLVALTRGNRRPGAPHGGRRRLRGARDPRPRFLRRRFGEISADPDEGVAYRTCVR